MVKSKKIKTVTTKELDEQELNYKELELVEKKGALEANRAAVKAMETKRDMDLEELDIKKHLATVVAANPLKFQEGNAYAEYLKRKMAFDMRAQEFMSGKIKSSFVRNKKSLDVQKDRCEEDIPKLEKRIGELKKNLLLYT